MLLLDLVFGQSKFFRQIVDGLLPSIDSLLYSIAFLLLEIFDVLFQLGCPFSFLGQFLENVLCLSLQLHHFALFHLPLHPRLGGFFP
jgi:hypothetical protein